MATDVAGRAGARRLFAVLMLAAAGAHAAEPLHESLVVEPATLARPGNPAGDPARLPLPESAASPLPWKAGTLARADWPQEGEIEYDVHYGAMSLRIGSATHRWSHDDRSYRMESSASAGGLLAVLGSLTYTQRSRGEVLPQGLRPLSFEVERGGRRRELAEFDWSLGKVDTSRDGKRRSSGLLRGDQDVLTLWHQLAMTESWSGALALSVVAGRSVARSRVEDLGDESIEVPAGRFVARHLRATALDGSLTIDVWLARERKQVPVRMRMRDRKGEVLDHLARRITLGAASAGIRNHALPGTDNP